MNRLLFFIFFCLFPPLYGGVVEDGLKQISWNDRILMRKFMQYNIDQFQATHVLCNTNKPVCLATAKLKGDRRTYQDVMWLKGLRAFLKHKHLFPHPNFIFSVEKNEVAAGSQKIDLYIINKATLASCLEEHTQVFQEVLGADFYPEEFIARLENGEALTALINKSEILLGILLGYGEESCRAYAMMRRKYKGSIPPHSSSYGPIQIKSPAMWKIWPIGFMGNPESEEVRDLVEKYESELVDYWTEYKGCDPLRVFLERVCEENIRHRH